MPPGKNRRTPDDPAPGIALCIALGMTFRQG